MARSRTTRVSPQQHVFQTRYNKQNSYKEDKMDYKYDKSSYVPAFSPKQDGTNDNRIMTIKGQTS